MKRRVCITGIGIVAPNGSTTDTFWHNCLAGEAPVAPIPKHWRDYTTFESGWWAPLQHPDARRYGVSRIHRMQLAQVSLLGICAAQQALEHAGFDITCVDEKKQYYRLAGVDPHRAGVFGGTGVGGLVSSIAAEANHVLSPIRSLVDSPERENRRLVELMRMPPRFNPFIVSIIMPNAVSSSLGIRYGLRGPNTTFTCACAAGTVAVGHAFEAIRTGALDMAVAGGAEYLADEYGGIFRGFDVAKTLARGDDPRSLNRPFDRDRTGFLFSEGGAGFLVLEEAQHARRRNAAVVAEIAGFAETFDACSMMSMAPGGEEVERMIRLALDDAALTTGEVDYINAHGTGTTVNDETESRVIEKVFGARPAVNSTKSLIGHTVGAAGAIEAAVTALSLKHRTTHISRNLEHPVNGLNYVRENKPREFRTALTQSFAFGGHNAGIVMKRSG